MATFTNQAQITYNGTTLRSNIVTGEVTAVLSAAKTAATDTYSRDDRITYVVSLVNSGALPYTGLTLTDDLGAYLFGDPATQVTPLTYEEGSLLYFVNGVLQATPSVTAGPPLTVTGISVPAGGDAILIYVATPNEYAPPAPNTIVNTATVTGNGLSVPLTAAASVSAEDAPSLAITKALSPSVIVENGQITYTFTIENYGSRAADATDNVILTDTFDPILDPISAVFNGTPWTDPDDYTYSTDTGLLATNPGAITVPAATYTQDPMTGAWSVTPGVSILVVTGTV